MPEDRSWKEFKLLDFFEPVKGDQNNMAGLTKGVIPLISAKNTDNGLKGLVSKGNKKLYPGGSLTLNNDGDGGAGISYYQPFEHYLDNHVTSLTPRISLSRYSLIYVSACITKQRNKFGHGYALNNSRLQAFKIMLPVTGSGEPDWEFMSSYIQAQEEKMIFDFERYMESSLNVETDEQSEPSWSEFSISEIFNIKPGKRLTKADMRIGKRPFVGATDSNNGITGFVSNENASLDSGVLGVNYNGSVVENFYHPYECIFSDDVKRFSLRDSKGNKFIYLFLKAAILKQRKKYQYGYKFNEARMKQQKIVLPINSKGEPDYAYMETYARRVEAHQLADYIKYLRARLVSS
jgi:hypothetical protein